MLEQFLAPSCTPTNLDIFLVPSAILRALQETTRHFSGTLLDVGCGYMPYKSLVLAPPSRATRYLGLDLERSSYEAKPDVRWDGDRIPLAENVVDRALATEVFEHCPSPEIIMGETLRVLKPGGLLFFTVPFLWPLHDVRTMSIAIRRSFWSVTSGTQCLRRSSSKRWAGGMRAQPRGSDCGSFADRCPHASARFSPGWPCQLFDTSPGVTVCQEDSVRT
jgi:SAM-dependent methyltransferase